MPFRTGFLRQMLYLVLSLRVPILAAMTAISIPSLSTELDLMPAREVDFSDLAAEKACLPMDIPRWLES